MTTITTYLPDNTQGLSGKFCDREFEIRYRKRRYGGWEIYLANGRHIGWLYKGDSDEYWAAYASEFAFTGTVEEKGHVLDEVPSYLTLTNGCHREPAGYGETRDGAVRELLWYLNEHKAPALGYSRHSAVERWEDRRR